MKKVIRVVSRDLSNNSVCGFHAMDPPKMHGNNLNSGKLLEIETCSLKFLIYISGNYSKIRNLSLSSMT